MGSPAFKAGGMGDPRPAGSIPVHLRHSGLSDHTRYTKFPSVTVVDAGAPARGLRSGASTRLRLQTRGGEGFGQGLDLGQGGLEVFGDLGGEDGRGRQVVGVFEALVS